MSFHQPDIAAAKVAGATIISIMAFTLSTPLQADDDELFFEMPVVLSASRLEQPLSETPMAVTSIDRELIEASGARTIPEVLRLVPGIVVGNSVNEWGEESKLIVSYHGHTDQYSKQMQVLIDGRSVYEPLLGGVDWNMLPINLEDIERIEVTRGPNSSTYGSNSFLAVINIITRHASEDPGQYVQFRAGNHDIADLTYRYGGNSGDLDYRVTLSTQNDDGLDARKNLGDRQYSDEFVDNRDDIHTGAVDYRADYQLNRSNQLTYQGGYSNTDLEINENFSPQGIRPARDSETIHAHQFLKLENTVDSKNSYVVQYYYNLLDKTDRSTSKIISGYVPVIIGLTTDPTDDFTLDLDFGLKSERHNLELTHFNQTTNSLRLIWGMSAQQDISESNYWLNDQGTIRRETYRLFGNSEWRINPQNLLNFGALLEKSKTLGTEVSPRLALIHKFNEKHSLRIGISKAIRSPFIGEEFGNVAFSHDLTSGGAPIGVTLVEQQLVPNSNIEHETIISREIGYFGQFLDDKLLINARIFHDRLDDLIQREAIPIATDNFDGKTHINNNLISTKVTGAELEFDLRTGYALRFFGNVNYLKIKSHDELLALTAEEYMNSAPEWTASLLVIKQFSKQYSGSLGLYHVGEMGWLDVPGEPASSYNTMDLRLSKTNRQSGSLSRLSLVLKNLLAEYNNYHHQPDIGPRAEQNLTGYIEYSISFN
ncbi:MAG: TonB-dependent receptor [Gammaproteobacteria bacterium]|nr:TonB-dependent receptor [Gammaproteobacteria bacterium]